MKWICNKLLKLLAIVLSVSFISIHAPSTHLRILRAKVAPNVYKVMNLDQRVGGTGFSIKTALGKTVVLTNEHVCGIEAYKIVKTPTRKYRLKVLKVSTKHDLCIIEGLPEMGTLSLGNTSSIGDTIAIVGHPRLTPLQVSRGHITTDIMKEVFSEGILNVQYTNAPAYPGNSGSPVVNFFGNVVGILFAGYGPHMGMIIPVKDVKLFLDNN